MRTSLFAAAMASVAVASQSDHWAVLVAGSNGYWNYRHQADTAHAYQIMKQNGISADHIIHMAYDDIRENSQNPFPGSLFNKTDGPNVAEGLEIHYTGRDVTPDNFLSVLKGEATTNGGRVLETNENSKVFVFFSDHGAPGLIAFPNQYLYADDLQSAFDDMIENKKFKEMVVYIEACESGSMFPNLRSDTKIYGVTASDATQSSWASYCSPQDTVNGVSIGSCLGDLFSTNWMENADVSSNMATESLKSQVEAVKVETALSPVLQFGDFSFTSEPIGDFEGSYDLNSPNFFHKMLKQVKSKVQKKEKTEKKSTSHVNSRDAKLNYLYTQVAKNGNEDTHLALQAELDHRIRVDNIFHTVFEAENSIETLVPSKYDCLRFMMTIFEENCGRFDDYSLKHVRYLSNHCETASPEQINATAEKIVSVCQQ